eukprot:3939684-Rhodomonas_salina.7
MYASTCPEQSEVCNKKQTLASSQQSTGTYHDGEEEVEHQEELDQIGKHDVHDQPGTPARQVVRTPARGGAICCV